MLIAAVLSGFVLIPNQVPPAISQFDIPPGLIPTIMTVVIAACALMIAIGEWRKWRRSDGVEAGPGEGEEGDVERFRGPEILSVALVGAALYGVWWVMAAARSRGVLGPLFADLPFGGFEVGGGLLLIVAMLLTGERRPLILIPLGFGLPALIAALAWYGLKVSLP